jgi:hypothetical protein
VRAKDVRAFSFVSSVGRIAIGVGMLAAPEHAIRALGFSEISPATVAVSRIAGVRDLVLGVVTLAAIDEPDRLRTATIANAAADAGDAAAFALAIRAGEHRAGVTGVSTALPATAAGLWVAWRLR